MKHRLVKLVAFLLLGAIVNVTVACLFWRSWFSGRAQVDLLFDSRSPNTAFDDQLWQRHAARSWPSSAPSDHAMYWAPGISSHFIGEISEWTGAVRLDETSDQRRERLRGTGTFEISSVSCGLPLPCLRIELWQESGSIDVPGIGPVQHDGILVGDGMFPRTLKPVGFAINTLFYAAILWGLFAAPFALRRRRRIKRGLCPKRAYDLRGCASKNCPECGRPVNTIQSERRRTTC